ncbi:glycerophosphodiester phosphodiesterase family protein [Sporosarcina sp. 6E9]|uniref:glycerophosphodiester phosphodiesterase n=1 Tax=Sporosarcina sp. 6E9 TaxID=2819235 RepID=UPI001B302CD0|nr:glycerophosphodiester phosphodiesterase family protein [Sporosarcina sp. 6E9]
MKRIIIGIASVIFCLAGCSQEKTDTERTPDEDFQIIAHRGASAYAPENTPASFQLAEEMNANYIELDIHLTKDGEIVVMHDEDVAKTTEGSGDIGTYTLAQLKELSVNTGHKERERNPVAEAYKVPTLREVFDQFGDQMNFMIELKESKNNRGIEEKLVDLLKEYEIISTADQDKKPKVVVHSFYEKMLKQVHELNEDILLLKLITFEEGETAELSKKELDNLLTYSSAIGIGHKLLNQDFIQEMNDKGLLVYATDVQDVDVAKKMQKIGAKGIFTNRPDILYNE